MITYKPVTDYSKGIGKLNTGLGNQMFQVASTIGIAIKNNQEWALPEWEHPFGDFPITDKKYKLRKVSWGYHDVVVRRNTSLCGYMQSEKYFKHCEDLIRVLFALPSAEYRGDFIAVHVRRGDYNGSHHTLLDSDYYNRALSLLPKLPIFVFTDDPAAALRTVPRADSLLDGDPFDDFNLMTRAKHHIIANSSFSWWAAWLANSEKVIAPRDWFGPKKPWPTEDIYCENWIVI